MIYYIGYTTTEVHINLSASSLYFKKIFNIKHNESFATSIDDYKTLRIVFHT